MSKKEKARNFLFSWFVLTAIFSLITFGSLTEFNWQYLFTIGLVSLGIQSFVPPFGLITLNWVVEHFRIKSFWEKFIGKSKDKDGKHIPATFEDLEKLDKLLSLSRNLLLIIGTIGAIIITLTSNGVKKWYNTNEVRVMGAIKTNCTDEVNPLVNDAFIIIDFLDADENLIETKDGQALKEIVKTENGQFSKILKLPRKVKNVQLKLFKGNGYEYCADKEIASKMRLIQPTHQSLIYQDIPIGEFTKTQQTTQRIIYNF